MAIYKRCNICHNRIPSGTTCECAKKIRAQSNKVYDKYQRNRESDQFYHSREWELTRDEVLRIDKGLDVYLYITTGEIVIADAVHHIEPLTDNWNRRCDIDNLISLSTSTHTMIEQMYKKDKEGTMKILYEMLKQFRKQG